MAMPKLTLLISCSMLSLTLLISTAGMLSPLLDSQSSAQRTLDREHHSFTILLSCFVKISRPTDNCLPLCVTSLASGRL